MPRRSSQSLLCPDSSNNHHVIPAQAGIHPEMLSNLSISGWTPALAGVTSQVLEAAILVLRTFVELEFVDKGGGFGTVRSDVHQRCRYGLEGAPAQRQFGRRYRRNHRELIIGVGIYGLSLVRHQEGDQRIGIVQVWRILGNETARHVDLR